jgi:aryl-alcohol dehydrogenase-like predicted oxidoreductase
VPQVGVALLHAGVARTFSGAGDGPGALDAPGGGVAHAGSVERLAVLGEVASDLGATPGQVVLAWLLARSRPPVIPVPGAGTVAQLDEILAATELTLDPDTINRLDQAGTSATAAAAW